MEDPTEELRRKLLDEINSRPLSREEFETLGIPFWDTAGLRDSFEVKGFMAPLVIVKRRSDGALGSLFFQHSPRIYWAFEEDKP